jgi:hypothetical protein
VLDFMASIRSALAAGTFPDLLKRQAALRDNSVADGLPA